MKFPSVLVAACVIAGVTFLQYWSGHIEAFGAPVVYTDLIALGLSTAVTLLQQWGAEQAPRDSHSMVATPRRSLLARVLVG